KPITSGSRSVAVRGRPQADGTRPLLLALGQPVLQRRLLQLRLVVHGFVLKPGEGQRRGGDVHHPAALATVAVCVVLLNDALRLTAASAKPLLQMQDELLTQLSQAASKRTNKRRADRTQQVQNEARLSGGRIVDPVDKGQQVERQEDARIGQQGVQLLLQLNSGCSNRRRGLLAVHPRPSGGTSTNPSQDDDVHGQDGQQQQQHGHEPHGHSPGGVGDPAPGAGGPVGRPGEGQRGGQNRQQETLLKLSRTTMRPSSSMPHYMEVLSHLEAMVSSASEAELNLVLNLEKEDYLVSADGPESAAAAGSAFAELVQKAETLVHSRVAKMERLLQRQDKTARQGKKKKPRRRQPASMADNLSAIFDTVVREFTTADAAAAADCSAGSGTAACCSTVQLPKLATASPPSLPDTAEEPPLPGQTLVRGIRMPIVLPPTPLLSMRATIQLRTAAATPVSAVRNDAPSLSCNRSVLPSSSTAGPQQAAAGRGDDSDSAAPPMLRKRLSVNLPIVISGGYRLSGRVELSCLNREGDGGGQGQGGSGSVRAIESAGQQQQPPSKTRHRCLDSPSADKAVSSEQRLSLPRNALVLCDLSRGLDVNICRSSQKRPGRGPAGGDSRSTSPRARSARTVEGVVVVPKSCGGLVTQCSGFNWVVQPILKILRAQLYLRVLQPASLQGPQRQGEAVHPLQAALEVRLGLVLRCDVGFRRCAACRSFQRHCSHSRRRGHRHLRQAAPAAVTHLMEKGAEQLHRPISGYWRPSSEQDRLLILLLLLLLLLTGLHDPHGLRVHGDGPQHGGRVPLIRAAALLRALANVNLVPLDQVVAGPESHQVSIVSRGRDAHGAGAAHVRVAQLVDGRLVPWNWEQSSSAVSSDEDTHEDQPQRPQVYMLDDLKVEVELCRMRDGLIHSGTSWDVAAAANFVFGVGAEQAGVVPLLHHHEGDAGLVVQLQTGARLAEGAQLNCSSSSLVMPHSSTIRSSLWAWTRTVAAYRLGWASMLATTAAMDGLERSPAGGWVTSPPMKMTGSRKTPGRTAGTRMELMPPSLTFIFRQRLLSVCGEVFTTFLACTHWVARPNRMSPTRFTSARPHGRLAGQHHHDELQALEGVLQVAEHRLHLVLAVGVLAEAGLAGDGHAGILADPLQLLGELPQRVLAHNALSGKAGDGPHLDLDAGEELLAAHVPDPLLRQRLRAAAPAVLNARRRQHPAAHLRHARNQHEKCTRESHLNAEGLQMAVVVEVGLPHQVVNLALPVRCGPGRGLDHGGRLRIRQLLDAALAADNVADFQRQARQHRIAQPHLIPLGEVLHNSAVESLAVLHLQREALGAGRPPGDVAHSRVVGGVQLRLLEEGPAHGGVLHAGQVAHDHVQRVHRLSRDAAATAFESLLQGEQGHLAQVAQADAKHAVLAALARQRHLQLQAVAAQRERVPAEILPAVEDRSLVEEEALVVHGVHHGVDDLPVDPARTLVRHNRHVIVMQEALGQPDLE
uniref:Uncharacterized protein n=1 Tax=Macrostomum lignano TaxID=282301 RepID=A0A1I8H9J9_9PLAT